MVMFLFLLFFSLSSFSSELDLGTLFNEQVNDYKEKNWPKVYARGHFYRHQYLRNDDEVKAAFSPKLYQLEIYAMAEKCQWKQVDKLAEEFKRLEKLKFNSHSKSDAVNNKIESFKAYKMVTKEKNLQKSVVQDLNSITVQGIDWSKVRNIEDIDIIVEDFCQK